MIFAMALLHQHPPKPRVFVNFVSHDSEVKVNTSPSALVKQEWKKRIFYGLIWKEPSWYTCWDHSGSSSESLELGIIWIFSLLIQLGFRSHGNVWKKWISPLKGVILRPKRFRLLAETSRRKEILKKKLFVEEIYYGKKKSTMEIWWKLREMYIYIYIHILYNIDDSISLYQ